MSYDERFTDPDDVQKGVDLEGEQKTKTRTALQYFSRHLGQD
ncbi:MAG: hypothetical protein QNL03_06105 [Gammaproteobacteria bacterium]|nr:hypothetical protein [Gammaproteobacteria bacterium]